MPIYNQRGLGFRLENEAQTQAAANYNPEESLAVESQAAAEVGEADMVGQEVEGTFAAMDDSMEVAEELGAEVIPQIADAAADEGLSPREAEGLSARIERLALKAGINPSTTGLVMRRENFGQSASRKQQTKMRLEAATGMLATVWENLKKAWAFLKDLVTSTWSKWTGNIEGIKKRLTDIQTRITALPAGAKPKDSRLKAKAKFFSIDRNTNNDTIEKVIQSVKGLAESGTVLRQALDGITAEGLQTEMKNTGRAETVDFFKGLINPIKAMIPEGLRARDKLSRNFKSGEKPEILAVLGAFPDGRSLVIEKTSIASGAKTATAAKVEMAVVEESFADDYEAPKDKNALNDLVNKGLDLANVLIKNTKAKAEMDEAINRVMAACDSMAKQATTFAESEKNADNDSVRNSVTVKVNMLKAAQTLAKAMITDGPKFLFDTAAALSDMAAAGVSNMKEDNK